MKFLYLHNFRGFDNTYIPIKDVNFLVGENSTGKTSILSILYLLSNPRFWISQDFNLDDIRLGSFVDIISDKSKSNGHFKIGFYRHSKKPNESYACLLTFGEKNGLPICCRYDYYNGKNSVSILFSDLRASVKVNKIRIDSISQSKLKKIFTEWIKGNEDETDFKQLKENMPFDRETVLLVLPNIIDRSVEIGEKENEIRIRLQMPLPFITWLAPTRSKPQKTYDQLKSAYSSEGEHIPYLIKTLIHQKKVGPNFEGFISIFGKTSGLFESIDIMTYGKEPASPFSLNAKLNGKLRNILYVGYGISQVLPVIVECFYQDKGDWFAIQQPEVHLHPKAQAALGEIFYNLAGEDNKTFMIETHSDYTIDRFRLKYRKKGRKINGQVLFFQRIKKGNKVTSIEILPNGEYSRNQPKKFREFFIKEELNLLRLR